MKKIAIPSLLVITLLLAAGCKPTEKNYKAAYDVALGKRKAVEAEMAEAAGGHEVISLDGPRRITAGGVEMNMVSEFLRMADKDEPLPPPALRYRVAAGRYRMPTNARAQMQTLSGEGFTPLLMADGEGRYYAVAGCFATPGEAAACVARLRKLFKAASFVGLDGDPLVVESPR